jgi:LPXTG-site transpeptidase (sortase) family protein
MSEQYTSEIHQLLKLGDSPASSPKSDLPIGLPMAESAAVPHDLPGIKNIHAHQTHESVIETNPKKVFRLKQLIIYPFVFLAAFAFFYIVLNFSSLLAQVQGWFIKPQAEVTLGQSLDPYYKWISAYYFSVGDVKLLDPNNDIDKDGLSNHDEFVMGTNPVGSDSDMDGAKDGYEVLDSTNPWGAGPATSKQVALAATLDASLINNRITYNASAQVSGYATPAMIVPKAPTTSSNNSTPTTPSGNGNVAGTSVVNFDLTRPGKLSIPRLKIQAPLIWSQDPANFEKDLTQGVIHYPGTALPGQRGVMYVSGHSSDYIWKKDAYSQVFAQLNVLQPGDDVFVEVYGLDGKTYAFRYQVSGKNVYSPDDQAQFNDTSASKLNLSTCWPIGSTKSRMVISAVQVRL